VQTDRQVRTQKESDQARGTHQLKSTDGQTSQDTERIQPSKGSLTSWRAQTDEQVRTHKESDQVRGTHFLENADGQTS